MLLIRELSRVAWDLLRFSVATRRIWLLLAVVIVALVALATTATTVVGPVVVYPFL